MASNLELEFLAVFVSESRELIQEVEPQLIHLHENELRTGKLDSGAVNSIFRLFHSMKGSAASLGLTNIASLTHKAETLLDLIREGKIKLSSEHVDALLKALDLAGNYLEIVESCFNDAGNEEEKKAIEDELEILIQSADAGDKKQKKGAKPSKDMKSGKKEGSASKKAKSVSKKAEEISAPEEVSEPVEVIDDEGRKSIVEQFVDEGSDFLDSAEGVLLELEKGCEEPGQKVRELFRGFHSFKGNCGFLGFEFLESISHKAENILEIFFDYEMVPAPEHIMTFLIIVDLMRGSLQNLADGGDEIVEGSQKIADLLDQMRQAIESEEKGPKRIGQILLEEGMVSEEQLAVALEKQKSTIGEVLVDMGAVNSETVEKALIKQTEQNAQVKSIGRSIKRTDLRVDLLKLDKLVNLVGELVIAETMVTRNPDLKNLVLENFDKAVHHLRRVTSELQDVALSVRMIPLAMTFQKMVRVVHDLARKEKKKVKLVILGEETEVDKTMTEQIADPLLHMVRNSIDHGIEPPEERLALGKPEVGKVIVEARYEGGEVWIVVSDDGRGLNREKIINTAMNKNLLKSDPSTMSDEEVFGLIFEPGFSTSDSVSEISGRGVGMDVVKKNIEKLKGRITVKSRAGHGSSIYLQIPLTLAIIDGMLVRVGKSRYTIPLLSIRESIRPVKSSITITPDHQELVRIREELIPVVRIHLIHGQKPDFHELEDGILIIVDDQGKKAAIFVDEILGQQQAVIKGLSRYLTQAKGISGCTILGDGAVSLILDIGGLVEKAGKFVNKISDLEVG